MRFFKQKRLKKLMDIAQTFFKSPSTARLARSLRYSEYSE
jgi:hypothetical protein